MASPEGGSGMAALAARLSPEDLTDAESGSSYIGSDESGPYSHICNWRTPEFNDRECSRYFDCPSHIVERFLSDPETESHDERETRTARNTHGSLEDRNEQEDSVAGGPSSEESNEAWREESGEVADTDNSGAPRADSPPALRPVPSPGMESGPATAPRSLAAHRPQLILQQGFYRIPDFVNQGLESPVSGAEASNESSSNLTQAEDPLQRQSPGLRSPSEIASPARTSERSELPDIVLPRWQPDAEVTYCPICHTQFSIFVRKHHCRKCGRVVCNSCSPHRITIPYQYIVQPPGQPRMYPLSFEGDYADLSTLGGGERVRLCNPCVPDPNTSPPRVQASLNQLSPRGHHRSQSTAAGAFGDETQSGRFYFITPPSNDAYSRNRSVTVNAGAAGPSSSRTSNMPFASTQNRILAGTPPVYYPGTSSSLSANIQSRHRSMLEVGSSSSSAAQQRALPPPPQIAEEDECPVCHRELPARTLPNSEVLREAHINICISAHSTYNGGVTVDSPQEGSGTPPPLAARRTGMFPYLATEKDCVDSAECTICLEEFEVGVPMARLECLCRFHRACISAWFVNHPGRCPVHQHDSFGF